MSDEIKHIETSIYWLKGVILQGTRVVEAHRAPAKRLQFNSPARIEELFFLTACRKAHRWLDGLKLPKTERFLELEPSIKEVRDNREHDEERYGIGAKKQEPLRKVPLPANGPKINASSSATVLFNNRPLLGGIVDVAEVMDAAKAILAKLVKRQHEYWLQESGESGRTMFLDAEF
ncbi:MAG: hypothetical protein K8T25_20470 [Planctomycetia bacterium]|nr:hypothetical protein [Planctomycetia bacterium]